MSNKVLHLNVMNNSGSTLLYNLISMCENSVFLKREGQSYAGVLKNEYDLKVPRIFSVKRKEIEHPDTYNLDKLKDSWMKEWRKNSKYSDSGKVLIQKSPSDVYRVDLLNDMFPNSYHIVMVRNPYAVCEGTIRRGQELHWGQTDVTYSIRNVALHCISCVSTQLKTINRIKNVTWFKYEDLFSRPEWVEDEIKDFLPELHDINLGPEKLLDTMWGIYNPLVMKDKNEEQVSRLPKDAIKIMSDVFKDSTQVFDFFDYKLL